MSYEDRLDDLVDALEERLEDFEDWSIKREYEEVTLTVPREQLLAVMQLLRRHKDISIDLQQVEHHKQYQLECQ